MAEGYEQNSVGSVSTHFAPVERASREEVFRIAAEVMTSPVFSTVLSAFGGIVAVLNRHRQILALNEGLLRFLGMEDGTEALGLRPGEVLHCVHSEDWPGGCGTSRFCSTCGAAISVVLALRNNEPQERECLLTVGPPGGESSIELMVRAIPLSLAGEPLVLLLLQDIRDEKRREAIEQVFLHDISNLLTSLTGYSSRFAVAPSREYPELAARVETLSLLLADEIRSHSILLDAERGTYRLHALPVDVGEVLQDVKSLFEYQPCSEGRILRMEIPEPSPTLRVDVSLLKRVLVNMVKNALEATPVGGSVRVWVEQEESAFSFRVHNPGWMEDQVAMRVFQRHFSTKRESGRGLGTYSMKLLGERCLGGAVRFVSSRDEGTTFSLGLPRNEKRSVLPMV